MSNGGALISQQIEVGGVYTLASAPAYDVSIVEPDDEYTAFTGHLIRLLGEGVPGEASTLPLGALFPHLRNALVSAVTIPSHSSASRQRPVSWCSYATGQTSHRTQSLRWR